MGDQELDAWTLTIEEKHSPAIIEAIDHGRSVALSALHKDPRDWEQPLPVVALMLKRDNESLLVPPTETRLNKGDQILFCGQRQAQTHMGWIMRDHNTLRYIQTGKVGPDGLLWRWLKERGQKMHDR